MEQKFAPLSDIIYGKSNAFRAITWHIRLNERGEKQMNLPFVASPPANLQLCVNTYLVIMNMIWEG